MDDEAIPPDSVKSFFKMLYTEIFQQLKNFHQGNLDWLTLVLLTLYFAVLQVNSSQGNSCLLGLALKSMTESEKVLTLINCYGYCASSETVRRVDMSLESTLNNSDSFIPNGIEIKPKIYEQQQLGITELQYKSGDTIRSRYYPSHLWDMLSNH